MSDAITHTHTEVEVTESVAPLQVSSLQAIAASRLFTVSVDALLVEVAARVSSAQISVVVVCDVAG